MCVSSLVLEQNSLTLLRKSHNVLMKTSSRYLKLYQSVMGVSALIESAHAAGCAKRILELMNSKVPTNNFIVLLEQWSAKLSIAALTVA